MGGLRERNWISSRRERGMALVALRSGLVLWEIHLVYRNSRRSHRDDHCRRHV
jgi:hypothetical protein